MAVSVVQARDPETYAIIGAAMEVHRELGPGFLEAAYSEALAIELTARLIPFAREVSTPIKYKMHQLMCAYRCDFSAYGKVIIENKAIKDLTDLNRAQVINYLKATGYFRGLLFNFGSQSLQYERIVLNLPE